MHYIEGRATVKDEHTVHINGKDYTVSNDVFLCPVNSPHRQSCIDAGTYSDVLFCQYVLLLIG